MRAAAAAAFALLLLVSAAASTSHNVERIPEAAGSFAEGFEPPFDPEPLARGVTEHPERLPTLVYGCAAYLWCLLGEGSLLNVTVLINVLINTTIQCKVSAERYPQQLPQPDELFNAERWQIVPHLC